MLNEPDISIIIPIYNAKKYLYRLLDSIIKQTYGNFEVIMIDDGSTDDSVDICQQYVAKDSRFRYYHQENRGPDIARKEGTKLATGEFLVYIDSDDRIAFDMLEKLWVASAENNADIVCSQIIRFNENKEWGVTRHKDHIVILDNSEDIFKSYFEDNLLIGSYCAKLIKRSIIADYDFVSDGLVGEDISAVLYMLENAQKIVILPDTLYFYYYNTSSISHSKYNRRHAVSLKNYISIRNRMLSKGLVSENRICAYFAGFQMAVATAMGRSGIYVEDTGTLLREDLRVHWNKIKADRKMPLYMKMCIIMYMTSPKMFIALYRGVYLTTGR